MATKDLGPGVPTVTVINTGGGGGTASGAAGSIQLSDGAGGFSSDTALTYDTATKYLHPTGINIGQNAATGIPIFLGSNNGLNSMWFGSEYGSALTAGCFIGYSGGSAATIDAVKGDFSAVTTLWLNPSNGSLKFGAASSGINVPSFGAGAVTSDGSGNLTSASDERLKDIQREFTAGLGALKSIKPITYKWNKESGYETEHEYSGFSAQNVADNIPEATGIDPRGYLSLQDRAIIATLVNAVNELAEKVRVLESR